MSTPAPSRPALKESPNCAKCNTSFGIFTHKYDCKGCGKYFCNACSSKRHVMPASFGYKDSDPQRVCGDCFFGFMEATVGPTSSVKLDNEGIMADLISRVKVISTTPETEWTRRCFDKGVAISTKEAIESQIHTVRSQVVIALPPARVVEMYTSKGLWKNWNPELIECRTLNTFPAHQEVLYVAYKFPVVDNRDAVLFSTTRPGLVDGNFDGCYHIMATSIEYPTAPKQAKFVRCHIGLSYTTFVPVENPKEPGQIFTRFTSIVHMDPCGNIPAMIVNQTLAHACDQIAEMRAFMVKNVDAGDKEIRQQLDEEAKQSEVLPLPQPPAPKA